MTNKHFPFWLLTIAVFIAMIVPALIQDGMFMDGIIYACISKNQAHGLGSFWVQSLSLTMTQNYLPPLVFVIQSAFFKLFGDGMYSERIYCFTTACITFWFIANLWKGFFYNDPEMRSAGWLPSLFWIVIPVVHWAFANNMLENTMGVFTTASVYYITRALNGAKRRLAYIVLSGALIFLATLSKGFPGLFPIAVPVIHYIVFQKNGFLKSLSYTFLLIAAPVMGYAFLWMNDEAYKSITSYFTNRVIFSIENVSTEGWRFYILYKLFMELLPILLAGIAVTLLSKPFSHFFRLSKNEYGILLYTLLIGVSGSFPLMATLEQRRYYMLASLPFYALGIAAYTAPALKKLLIKLNNQSISFRFFRASSIVILTGVIGFSFLQVGKASRDEEMLQDVHLIGSKLVNGTIIGLHPSLSKEYSLQSYLTRYYNISLDSYYSQYEYSLHSKEFPAPDTSEYIRMDMNTIKYDLFKKTKIR